MYKLLFSVWDQGRFVGTSELPYVTTAQWAIIEHLHTKSGKSYKLVDVDERSLVRLDKGLSLQLDKWVSAAKRPSVLLAIQRALELQLSGIYLYCALFLW